ncbi:hypothetical protein ES702_00691 [subsurface metagenome]
MVIWFNSEKARKHLISKGVVVTCRKQRKHFGTHKAVFTNEKGERELINHVDIEYLNESWDEQREHDKVFYEYIHLSGFNTVEEWKDEVRRLNSNRWMPTYLIFLKVTMDRDLY